MQIALISDIHGNDVALQAVLADIERRGVDDVVCLGDVSTLGPSPRAALLRVHALGCACVLGNHDEFLLEPDRIRDYTNEPTVVGAVAWARDLMEPDDLDYVRTFEPTIERLLGSGLSMLLFHGTPASNTGVLLATTPPDEVDRVLQGYQATIMAGGHTHVQMFRQHRGTLLVNPGSVGLPFREFVGESTPRLLHHAEYAVVESDGSGVNVTLHRVALDKDALLAAAAESESPLREFLVQQYA